MFSCVCFGSSGVDIIDFLFMLLLFGVELSLVCCQCVGICLIFSFFKSYLFKCFGAECSPLQFTPFLIFGVLHLLGRQDDCPYLTHIGEFLHVCVGVS